MFQTENVQFEKGWEKLTFKTSYSLVGYDEDVTRKIKEKVISDVSKENLLNSKRWTFQKKF
mgnify:CR=1 FL=1